MRIDKIIDKITKAIFSPKFIWDILENNIPYRIKYFSMLISLKKIILLKLKWPFQGIKNIEWIEKYNISAESFNPKYKKNGISAIVRLKNWDQFLETCIVSLIDYIDEFILLVDINWTDNTNNICIELSKKYPEKIKHYEYEPVVYPGNHEKYSITPDNSVHSLSYFYNYCMSKVNYNYVMKLDDDMLVIDNAFVQNIKNIKENNPNFFLAIPQINIYSQNNNYCIATKYLSSWIAGLFWDHWIFPISRNTYFFNDIWCENLIMPYKIKYWKLSFLHLKNIKSDWWIKNYNWYWAEYVAELSKNSKFISIPEKYKKTLEKIF